MATKKDIPFIFTFVTLVFLSTPSCNNKAGDDKSTLSNDRDSSGVKTGKPLPSWNEGNTKKAIIDFVKSVTTEGSFQASVAKRKAL